MATNQNISNPAVRRIQEDYYALVNRRPSGPNDTERNLLKMSTFSKSLSALQQNIEESVDSREIYTRQGSERDFKRELAVRLEKQRRSIDSYEATPFISPLLLPQSEPLSPKPHYYDGRPPSFFPDGNIMEELKQRLSRTQVSSNFDVDRIVKESKTTTITESRETIHFRPSESVNPLKTVEYAYSPTSVKGKVLSSPPITSSIKTDYEGCSTRPNDQQLTTSKVPITGGDSSLNTDDLEKLMSNYVNLDSNETKSERRSSSLAARERFFSKDNQSKETGILKSTLTPSSHINQWESTRSNSLVRRLPASSTVAPVLGTTPSTGRVTMMTSSSVSAADRTKSEGCPFKIIH